MPLTLLFLSAAILCSLHAGEPGWERSLAVADSLALAHRPDSALVIGTALLEKLENPTDANAEPIGDAFLGRVLLNLGRYTYLAGDYPAAEDYWRRSLSLRERCLPADHPDLARTLNNLGLILYVQGHYREAEDFMLRGTDILETAPAPNKLEIAMSLTNLANLHVSQNNFAIAESLLNQSLEIIEALPDPRPTDLATNLNSLGSIYHRQRRYEDAVRVFRRALDLYTTHLGEEHPHVGFVLENLGMVRRSQGQLGESETYQTRALSTLENSVGPEHPSVAPAVRNLGNLYVDMGEYAKAEPLLQRAATIIEKSYGVDHLNYASTMVASANMWRLRGDYARAESLCVRSLNICESVFGPENRHTAECLEMLSGINRAQRRDAEALALARRAWAVRQKNLVDNAIALSEEDVLEYSEFAFASGSSYLSCYFDTETPSPEMTEEALGVIFGTKGHVSDIVFERQALFGTETDSVSIAMLEDLKQVKLRLSRLFVEGPRFDLPAYQSRIDTLNRRIRDLEGDLSLQSRRFGSRTSPADLTAERVASHLPAGSVLIEYMNYDYASRMEEDPNARYLVAVVAADGQSDLIDLGEASVIDPMIQECRRQMLVASNRVVPSEADANAYREIAGQIYEKIWQPVEDLVQERDLVFVAPDGTLNLLSFAALVDGEGSYLLENTTLHYLTAARDIFRLNDNYDGGSGLLALGDPDYDASVELREYGSPTLVRKDVASRFGQLRNARSSCRNLQDLLLDRLPGSADEIQAIAAAWMTGTDEDVMVLVDAEASEDQFKAKAPGARVIHLATHGYFFEADCAPRSDTDQRVTSAGENPLLLSGLFMAGANLRGKGTETGGVEDGIVTAYEVTAMDLEGTELVVLSGCETGLGQVRTGEGVYGLRRAFQIAGARTVISALWPVSDRLTAEIMSRLYTDIDEENASLAGTMRELQLAKLREFRAEGLPDHPAGWGAFVVVGDWDR